MAFCNQCGAQLQDGAAFCPACGAQQGAAPQQAAPQQGQAGQAGSGFDFKALIENTPDFTSQMDPADIEANKSMAILSYIWILFIVPLVAAPQSKFARFHANQGLVLCVCWIAASLIVWIPIVKILSFILYLVGLGYMVIGIMNANNGKAKELPFIGKFRIIR
ncbi:MAG: zinc-ribbon domain-containing protein [Lachnospiraceae bacterium]|nr:zinc-ribbon domain-containing protein [Lachnospiraceae bacterium]